MVPDVDRTELLGLLARGDTQLIEVLPAEEFAWAHPRGARNLPLKSIDEKAVSVLDDRRPLVVYCNDFL